MKKIKFTESYDVSRISEPHYHCANENGMWEIVLARGACKTGGYDIHLHDLTMDNGVLTAVVHRQNPEPGSFCTMAITFPTRKYILDLDTAPTQVIFKDMQGEDLEVIYL